MTMTTAQAEGSLRANVALFVTLLEPHSYVSIDLLYFPQIPVIQHILRHVKTAAFKAEVGFVNKHILLAELVVPHNCELTIGRRDSVKASHVPIR